MASRTPSSVTKERFLCLSSGPRSATSLASRNDSIPRPNLKQMGRQNDRISTMKAYLQAFINFEQNDWAKLLPMTEFAYNDTKNASTGHTPFELNCGYHPWMSYIEKVNPHS